MIGRPEMSVRNYHCSLGNNPEERSSQLLIGVSLNSLIFLVSHQYDLLYFLVQCILPVLYKSDT